MTRLGTRHCVFLGIQVSKSAAIGGTLQLYSLVPLGFRKIRDALNTFLLDFSYCLPSGKTCPGGAGQVLPFQLSIPTALVGASPALSRRARFAQSSRAVCWLLTCFTVENSSTSITYRKRMNISFKWSGCTRRKRVIL